MIGFVITAGGYGAGATSDGCFNPAVAPGLDMSSACQGIKWGPTYCGFVFIDACLAAGLFRAGRPDGGEVRQRGHQHLRLRRAGRGEHLRGPLPHWLVHEVGERRAQCRLWHV